MLMVFGLAIFRLTTDYILFVDGIQFIIAIMGGISAGIIHKKLRKIFKPSNLGMIVQKIYLVN